jgi:predicted O-methyltransferase YrrM
MIDRNTYVKFDMAAVKLARAFGFLYEYEVIYLMILAHTLPAGAKIVNIGSGSGTSGLSMSLSRPDVLNDAHIWTVDISEGGPGGGLLNETNAFDTINLQPYTQQVLGNSAVVGPAWPFGDINMLFIDGDHSTEGITSDIDGWVDHIVPGGIIAIHDYEKSVWPDVQKVVDQKLKGNPEKWEFILQVDTIVAYRKKGAA